MDSVATVTGQVEGCGLDVGVSGDGIEGAAVIFKRQENAFRITREIDAHIMYLVVVEGMIDDIGEQFIQAEIEFISD